MDSHLENHFPHTCITASPNATPKVMMDNECKSLRDVSASGVVGIGVGTTMSSFGQSFVPGKAAASHRHGVLTLHNFPAVCTLLNCSTEPPRKTLDVTLSPGISFSDSIKLHTLYESSPAAIASHVSGVVNVFRPIKLHECSLSSQKVNGVGAGVGAGVGIGVGNCVGVCVGDRVVTITGTGVGARVGASVTVDAKTGK